MIYKFITPSDPITFIAQSDKIAFLTCLLLGEGKAGCSREDGEDLNTFTAFADEGRRKEIYVKYCGTDDVKACFDENLSEVSDALLSFCYGDFESRKQYNDAIAAITDSDKLAEFKAKHEDRNRTSMSQWVQAAWNYGKNIKLIIEKRKNKEL